MWEDYNCGIGLLNQISAAPNANIISNYEYIKSTFAPLADIRYTDSSIPKNYKLLKRNRYLKLV